MIDISKNNDEIKKKLKNITDKYKKHKDIRCFIKYDFF
jgi:hypothetical protein